MMVRKMEEGYDKVRAATFAYEATAMPMLTGTLITVAGFTPVGMARDKAMVENLRDRGIGVPITDHNVRASVLRQSALGDVEAGHDLEA